MLPAVGLVAAVASAGAAAEDPFAECEALFRSDPLAADGSRCFYDRSRLAERRDQAADRLHELVASGPPDNAFGYRYLGNIDYLRDRPESAIAYYRRAIELFAASGRPREEGIVRLSLVKFLARHERVREAETELAAAVTVAESAGDEHSLLQARIEQARLLRQQGAALGRAYRLLREVESRVFPDGDPYLQKDCLNLLGALAHDLGREAEARDFHRRNLALARQRGDRYMEASILGQLGMSYLLSLPTSEARRKAKETFERALEAALLVGQPQTEAQVYLWLGRMAGGEEGRDLLRRCIEVAAAVEASLTLAHCRDSLAVLVAEEDPDLASQLIREVLTTSLETGSLRAILYGSRERMIVAWATLPPVEALRSSLADLDLIETQRDLQETEFGRMNLFSTWSKPYHWLVGHLLEGGTGLGRRSEVEHAFAVLERLRARLLREHLALLGREPERPPVEELKHLLGRIAEANRRIVDPTTPPEARREAIAELAELEREEIAFHELDGGSDAGEPLEGVSLEQVEQALAPGQAMLAFQMGLWEDMSNLSPGGAWLLVSTRQGTRAYRLPGRLYLEPALPVFLGLVARRDGSEIVPSVELYRRLLAPALADLPDDTTELIVVPEGDLHRLPFAALRSSVDAAPLGARYQLTVVPSADLFHRWREAENAAGSGAALVLTDPAFSDSAWRGVAEERDWRLDSPPGALPWARKEGRSLIRRLGGGSRLLEGADASEALLKSTDLGAYDVLHFAAHAVVDSRYPQRSSVLLAPGASSEDGLLQPRDILQLDLRGKTVVLSACRSASGAVVAGEGVVGLARAFFRAGASAVLGNLWVAEDRDAAQFFDHFYASVARGETLAAALREARRGLAGAGKPAAAWAGLVLIGDGQLRLAPSSVRAPGSANRLGAGVLALVLSALLVAVWLQRRRGGSGE